MPIKEFFDDIVKEILRTQGRLNFNDAYMVLLAKRFSIRYIASFDEDFDATENLVRIKQKEDVMSLT